MATQEFDPEKMWHDQYLHKVNQFEGLLALIGKLENRHTKDATCIFQFEQKEIDLILTALKIRVMRL